MSQNEKADMILNILSEIVSVDYEGGTGKSDFISKIMEIGSRVDLDCTVIYKRAKEMEAKRFKEQEEKNNREYNELKKQA